MRSGKALYKEAIRIYNSWDNALMAAGLDPAAIWQSNSAHRCSYSGVSFSSILERDTAIILLYFKLIPEIALRETFQVKVRDRYFDFYSSNKEIFFEPHGSYWTGQNIADYWKDRREILDQNGHSSALLYAFENTAVLLDEILPELGIVITAADREIIRSEILKVNSNSPIEETPVFTVSTGLKDHPIPAHAAAEGASYRDEGPGTDNYRETGAIIQAAVADYLDEKQARFVAAIEYVDAVGKANAASFLSILQKTPGGVMTDIVVELYSISGKSFTYDDYNLEKKDFSAKKIRANTLTLFVTGKDEDLKQQDLVGKIGDYTLSPANTILMPVGMDNEGKDLSGLIRSTVLGLRLMKIAGSKVDREFITETLDQFRVLCSDSVVKGFDLTEDDLIEMVTGSINDIMRALKKLIKLLPITPIDLAVLEEIYRNAKKTLVAA
ncbi:MAG: hypothetical protein NTY34_02820 [Candidatus Omnitrophica bacterium]|nr:hypothetical protein [Candidatus Omnitrophota bacterium]